MPRYARTPYRRKKKSYTRKSYRRSSVKTRPYRKRTRYPRRMTTKAILNKTSLKKRDTMLCYTNSTSGTQQGGSSYQQAAAVINGGLSDSTCAAFLWNATARDNTLNQAGNIGNRFTQATRTSTTPYMVGLSENIEIQCNNGMPWQWRRICFTMKGTPLVLNSTTAGAYFYNAIEANNGWTRVMNQVPGNPGNDPLYTLMVFLFKGQINSDWNDPMTAPTDNSRVTIKYDKTVSLASGNEDGFIRKYKRWHPMKKTLVYNDDEIGGNEQASVLSAVGKAGMGDYYVLDLFRARQGSATSDQLTVRPESTLYWHEK
uniref:Capsid protein n=1 Tax=Red panda feces-associated gemycircularvirus TaxID=2864013 RepID=A0A8K1HGZ3_9VIRU|nr:capsid protein [Red panda feces-associated gemycircularvirus]